MTTRGAKTSTFFLPVSILVEELAAMGIKVSVCSFFVFQAVGRHESLTSQNMERKARWREEAAAQSVSAKP